MSLHLWFNGEDYVAAENAEEAQQVVIRECGYDAEEARGDGWRRVPGDLVLRIFDEDAPKGEERRETTAAALVAGLGRPGIALSLNQ